MTDDFYDLLEISPDAAQDEVKTAFREQVRVYHPDVNDDERARAQFTALKKAYDILSDPSERQAYDRLGHEDYVAKRTSGIPSPDVWSSDSGGSASTDDGSGTTDRTSEGSASTAGGPSSTAGGPSSTADGSTTASSSTTTGSSHGSSGSTGESASATGRTTSSGRTRGTTADSTTTAGTGSSAGSGSSAGTGGATRGTAGSGSTSAGGRQTAGASGTDAFATPSSNPVVRWWNRQNFSLPLLWISILTYLVGLAHFSATNESGLRSFADAVSAAGSSIDGLRGALTGRHGIETPLSFVAGVELVPAPLGPPAWYAALAGIVGLAIVAILIVRVRVYRLTWQRLTINETILLAVAVGIATTLLGGPLLAGAALMPLLFGVIVYRTRQLSSGWAPSYVYVLAVCAPLVGLGVHAGGYDALAVDLAAFVVVPIAGALGLPLRLRLRRWIGR